MSLEILTIGHSTHTTEKLIQLLQSNRVTAVADVRSSPYSRYNPQFDRETLQSSLKENDIQYVYLGEELGGRSNDASCYKHNKIQYELLAQTEVFKRGISRIIKGSEKLRLSLMCAEKDPLECHRTILVARELQKRGLQVGHIHEDGSVEKHDAAIQRLRFRLGLVGTDLFSSEEQQISNAYRIQADRIAYVKSGNKSSHIKQINQ